METAIKTCYWSIACRDWKTLPMSKVMKISEFTDDQSDQVVTLWEKCGLTRSWNDPQKDIGRKNSDLNGKFLVGQVDGVLMASIMIGYDGHRGSINYLAVDPDYSGAGYGKILMAEAERFLILAGCPKINFCVRTDNDKVVEFYQKLGYAIEPVHLLGKRLIKDD
jgi:ribosomal protein S18 acetylase RimI-like enzyme